MLYQQWLICSQYLTDQASSSRLFQFSSYLASTHVVRQRWLPPPLCQRLRPALPVMLQASTPCLYCCYFTLQTHRYWCWDSSPAPAHWHCCLSSWSLWPCRVAVLFGSGDPLRSQRQQFHRTSRSQAEAPRDTACHPIRFADPAPHKLTLQPWKVKWSQLTAPATRH